MGHGWQGERSVRAAAGGGLPAPPFFPPSPAHCIFRHFSLDNPGLHANLSRVMGRHAKLDGAGRKSGFPPGFLLPLPVPFSPGRQAYHTLLYYYGLRFHPCMNAFPSGFGYFCAISTQVPFHEQVARIMGLFQSTPIKANQGKSRYFIKSPCPPPLVAPKRSDGGTILVRHSHFAIQRTRGLKCGLKCGLQLSPSGGLIEG